MHRYKIHNFLEIIAHDDVNSSILQMLNFQVGFFSYKNHNEKFELPEIKIFSYKKKNEYQNKNLPEAIFYNDLGSVDNFLHIPEKNLFIKKEGDKFIICADYANFTITLFMQILLLSKNCSFIHASAFQAKSGKINIFTGVGGIGKTLILGHASTVHKLKYLGDDLIILDDRGSCFSYPRNFVLKKYHIQTYSNIFQKLNISKKNLFHLKKFVMENFPLIGLGKKILKKTGLYYLVSEKMSLDNFLGTVAPDEIFGDNMCLNEGLIGKIVYVDRIDGGNSTFSSIPRNLITNRIFSVMQYEWKETISMFYSMAGLSLFNIINYNKGMSDVLQKSIDYADCVHVNLPKSLEPQKLIDFLEKNNLFS